MERAETMNALAGAKTFDAYVAAAKALLAGAGLQPTEEKPIPYGLRLNLQQNGEIVPLTLYYGKKGFSLVLAGKDGVLKAKLAALFQLAPTTSPLAEAALFDSPPKSNKPYGFEALEGFESGWIGTDESGKGDVFGPLVVAAVAVNPTIVGELERIGVKDCKQLSDKKVSEFAGKIRQICQGHFQELILMPSRYNSLYKTLKQEGKNLNHLMGWAHARVIEDTLAIAPCKFAIADKFADVRLIENRLMARGRNVVLIQKTQAEQNIAVAAASVLARDSFLRGLASLSQKYGVDFPKGAGTPVAAAIRQFVAQQGKELLAEVGKVHFRTFEGVL